MSDKIDPNSAAAYRVPRGLPSVDQIEERHKKLVEKLELRQLPPVGIDAARLGQMLNAIRKILIRQGLTTAAEIEYYIRLEALEFFETLERDTRGYELRLPNGKIPTPAQREVIRKLGGQA